MCIWERSAKVLRPIAIFKDGGWSEGTTREWYNGKNSAMHKQYQGDIREVLLHPIHRSA